MALKTGTPKIAVEVLIPQGTSQADATPIRGIWAPALIIASGNAVGGLRFPVASKGKVFYVKNINTTQLGLLYLYPAVGDTLDVQGTNNVLIMQSLSSAMFVADANHRWHTLPALSS